MKYKKIFYILLFVMLIPASVYIFYVIKTATIDEIENFSPEYFLESIYFPHMIPKNLFYKRIIKDYFLYTTYNTCSFKEPLDEEISIDTYIYGIIELQKKNNIFYLKDFMDFLNNNLSFNNNFSNYKKEEIKYIKKYIEYIKKCKKEIFNELNLINKIKKIKEEEGKKIEEENKKIEEENKLIDEENRIIDEENKLIDGRNKIKKFY
jgi:hypothetical protein